MLKGFIVIFTAIISYLLLKKTFTRIQIVGIFSVIVGLVLVGICNIHSYNPKFAPRPILGNSLVIAGQFFLAGMFVYEEKILKEYDVHVFEIVGWEGIWGMLISSLFIVAFFFVPGRDNGSYENPIQASVQIYNNLYLLAAILCSSLVIGPFNYYGTNLTKYSSAMHRCLIDASRMCLVWMISLCCGWEHFKLQQCLGYCFVMMGNFMYYEIIKLEFIFKKDQEEITGAGDIEKTNLYRDQDFKVLSVKKPSTFSSIFIRMKEILFKKPKLTSANYLSEEKDLLNKQ